MVTEWHFIYQSSAIISWSTLKALTRVLSTYTLRETEMWNLKAFLQQDEKLTFICRQLTNSTGVKRFGCQLLNASCRFSDSIVKRSHAFHQILRSWWLYWFSMAKFVHKGLISVLSDWHAIKWARWTYTLGKDHQSMIISRGKQKSYLCIYS